MESNKGLNLVLSGGGIKGVAFIGVHEMAEKRGHKWKDICGVSAGALVGGYISAGYKYTELLDILYKFDFNNINVKEIPNKVPVVSRYYDFIKNERYLNNSIEKFFEYNISGYRIRPPSWQESDTMRGKVMDNIIAYSEEGCLFDGDFLQEWIYRILLKKGIRTFSDLKSGNKSKTNPSGYKMRMTAVDATRKKTIVLPDDITFYGINPDKLEVADAIRMSTSVPFAFKPYKLQVTSKGKTNIYNIVDGGVFDNFPHWLIDVNSSNTTVGFRLDTTGKKKFFSLKTPLNILKSLISHVHNIGIPKYTKPLKYVGHIDTGDVSFVDFDLSKQEKDYLYKAGKRSALDLFNKLEKRSIIYKRRI